MTMLCPTPSYSQMNYELTVDIKRAPSPDMNQKSDTSLSCDSYCMFFWPEGKKSLYIRLGCRGDWPDIKPPGWDPSTSPDASPPSS